MQPFPSGFPVSSYLPALREFCVRWDIDELALFGSVTRSDFGPDSDVDVLVRFREGVTRSLLDYPKMQRELEALFGRRVDVVSRRGVERSHNARRRAAILDSASTVYAA
jgi:predicted nucleotidyltransferase